MNKHFLSASIVLVSIAIFYFAFQLGKSSSVAIETVEPLHNVEIMDKGLLTSEEVAAYLSMDVEQFQKLIKNQNMKRAENINYDTYKYIPYIQMNGEKYFSKNQVDEWINYNMTNWENIHN